MSVMGFTIDPGPLPFVEPHVGACPPELLPIYSGKKLIRVHLEAL
jgi:hypothetical protein